MKTCSYCGQVNDDSAIFCAGCGTQKFEGLLATAEPVPTRSQNIEPQAPTETTSHCNIWGQFLPTGKSKAVFVLVVTAYGWMAESIIAALMRAFRLSVSQVPDYERHGPLIAILVLLVLGPLVESLFLLGLIELLRKLRAPAWIQIVAPACIISALHSGWPAHPLVVAPSFLIETASYLYWRTCSKRVAYAMKGV